MEWCRGPRTLAAAATFAPFRVPRLSRAELRDTVPSRPFQPHTARPHRPHPERRRSRGGCCGSRGARGFADRARRSPRNPRPCRRRRAGCTLRVVGLGAMDGTTKCYFTNTKQGWSRQVHSASLSQNGSRAPSEGQAGCNTFPGTSNQPEGAQQTAHKTNAQLVVELLTECPDFDSFHKDSTGRFVDVVTDCPDFGFFN